MGVEVVGTYPEIRCSREIEGHQEQSSVEHQQKTGVGNEVDPQKDMVKEPLERWEETLERTES